MLTILSTVFGFVSSLLPDAMGMLKRGQEHKHRMEMQRFQAQMAKEGHLMEMQKYASLAEIEESKGLYQHDQSFKNVAPWMDTFRASVRPVITYSFFVLFIAVEIFICTLAYNQTQSVAESVVFIWNTETQSLFAAIIAFWFGTRNRNRVLKMIDIER